MKLQVSCIWNLQITPQNKIVMLNNIHNPSNCYFKIYCAGFLQSQQLPSLKHSKIKCYNQHLQQASSKPRSRMPKTKSVRTNQTPNRNLYPTTNRLRFDLRTPTQAWTNQTRNAINRICIRKIQNQNWLRTLCNNYGTLSCTIITTKNGRSSIFFSPITIPTQRNAIASTRIEKIQDIIN